MFGHAKETRAIDIFAAVCVFDCIPGAMLLVEKKKKCQ